MPGRALSAQVLINRLINCSVLSIRSECSVLALALGIKRLLLVFGRSVPTAPVASVAVARRPPSRVRALGPSEDAHEGLVRLLHLVELGGGRLVRVRVGVRG